MFHIASHTSKYSVDGDSLVGSERSRPQLGVGGPSKGFRVTGGDRTVPAPSDLVKCHRGNKGQMKKLLCPFDACD